MQYIQEVIKQGSWKVVINEYSDGQFYCRLYQGETATETKRTASSLRAAINWAQNNLYGKH